MYLSIFWTKSLATTLISISLSEVASAKIDISESAEKLFTKCNINNDQERVSILATANENFEKTVSSFDFNRDGPDSAASAGNAETSPGLSLDVLRSESYDPKIEGVAKGPTPPGGNPSNPEKSAELGYEKLQRLAIQRRKGYIVFEDGENDDHLQNYMAYLYDKRIPEMIVLHGGNAQLRYKCYEWVWNIMQKRTGCEIPEILIGGQGRDDLSVFDIVEGSGAIDEATRQRLLANPMKTEDRESEAQKTYAKVANYISKLDKVIIGLKTAPTDLARVVDILKPEVSREKMLIVWATPGSFDTKTGVLEMHAKFNYHRNYEASDKILASGIKTVLTGNGLSDTQARGFIDVTHAAEIRKSPDNDYKDFEGFHGLKELVADAKEGTFFYFYREVQHLFQKEKVIYGKKLLKYVVEPKKEMLQQVEAGRDPMIASTAMETQVGPDLVDDSLISQESTADVVEPRKEMLRQVEEHRDPMVGSTAAETEVGLDFEDDRLISRESVAVMLNAWYEDLQANKKSPEKLASMRKQIKDLNNREGYLVKHWGPLLKIHPDLIEGCTADPHLELILNAYLRRVSIMEIIPAYLVRKEEFRPQVIDVEIKEGSNTWIVSQIDATTFISMFQDLINWEKKAGAQMPWESFEYGTKSKLSSSTSLRLQETMAHPNKKSKFGPG